MVFNGVDCAQYLCFRALPGYAKMSRNLPFLMTGKKIVENIVDYHAGISNSCELIICQPLKGAAD